jgi:Flp pilus assembly protein TadB
MLDKTKEQKYAESISTAQTSSSSSSKKDWVTKWIQKMSQLIQKEENKKMIHVFLVDPILNHVLERIFPYILILCVLFVVLTIMISLTLLLLFMRLPAAFGTSALLIS